MGAAEQVIERALEVGRAALEAVPEDPADLGEPAGPRGLAAEDLDPVARSTLFSSIKLLGHLDRLGAWQRGDPLPGLITVDVDPTQRCNSRCPGCTYAAWRSVGDLDRDLFRSLVDQAAEAGARSLVLTGGGEPLLNPYTPHAVQLADSLGLEVGLITNGLALDEALAARLLECDRLRWVRVSLNAGTPEGYAAASGLPPSALSGLVENVLAAAAMRQRVDSRATLGASALTRPGLLAEIPVAAALARELGLAYLQVKPLEVVEGGRSEQRYEDVDARRALLATLSLQTPSFRVMTSRTAFFKTGRGGSCSRSYDRCHGLHFSTAVGADGKAYACCHTKYVERFALGDLAEQSLEEVLRSRRRRDVMLDVDVSRCLPHCRLHEANELLAAVRRVSRREHLKFI